MLFLLSGGTRGCTGLYGSRRRVVLLIVAACLWWVGGVVLGQSGPRTRPTLGAGGSASTSQPAPTPVPTRGGTVGGGTSSQGDEYLERHALLIFNYDYNPRWPSLPGVRNDVAPVRAILEKHHFQITLRENRTLEQMQRDLNEFVNQYGANPRSLLLLYYAGHGDTTEVYGEKVGFLIPVDGAPKGDITAFVNTNMPMKQIEVFATRMLSLHALFIFDACFAGTIFSAYKGSLPIDIQHAMGRPVRHFITAGEADEPVPDNSSFRRYLVRALEGDADANRDRFLSGSELGLYLGTEVTRDTQGRTHPQSGKLMHSEMDRGEVVFFLPESASRPASESGPGRLFLNARPVSTAYLNGTRMPELPVMGRETESGTYTLRFEHPNRGSLEKSITLRAQKALHCVALFDLMRVECEEEGGP